MLTQCLEIKARGCCIHVFLVTYILSASTEREAIVFIYRNFKAEKQSFPAFSVSANQVEEIFP